MEREKEPKVIIATKGHLCTGKTTLALSLAKLCKYPLIKLDDLRDSILKLQQSLKNPIPESTVDDLSYEAVCRITEKVLQLKAKVVIDCPLSHRTHLDRLLQLSNSTGSSLVIVECKPKDAYEWQMRLERRAESESETQTLKIIDWEKLVSLVKNYEDYDVGDLPKLFVNTTAYVKDFTLAHAVHLLAAYSKKGHRVDFHQWGARRFAPLEGESSFGPDLELEPEDHLVNHCHEFKLIDDHNDNEAILCNGCLKPISTADPFYSCNYCKFFLHKSCAESPKEVEQQQSLILPFLKPNENDYEYCFQEEQTCNSCEEAKRGFSYDCTGCLFLTHLRSNLLPSVVANHECHREHSLFLGIFRISDGFEYLCHACGDIGKHVGYACVHCLFVIHVSCTFLPITRKEKNHMHSLKLTSPPSKEESDIETEELYCDACERRMNPKYWMYYCEDCDFPSHLDCAKAAS